MEAILDSINTPVLLRSWSWWVSQISRLTYIMKIHACQVRSRSLHYTQLSLNNMSTSQEIPSAERHRLHSLPCSTPVQSSISWYDRRHFPKWPPSDLSEHRNSNVIKYYSPILHLWCSSWCLRSSSSSLWKFVCKKNMRYGLYNQGKVMKMTPKCQRYFSLSLESMTSTTTFRRLLLDILMPYEKLCDSLTLVRIHPHGGSSSASRWWISQTLQPLEREKLTIKSNKVIRIFNRNRADSGTQISDSSHKITKILTQK